MDFTKLKNYLDNIDTKVIPSYRLAVKKGNETVFEYFNAASDIFESEKERDMCYLFSVSKVITCAAAMRLYEDGLLDLNAPVAEYLPEYSSLYIGGDFNTCSKPIDKATMPKAKNTLLVKHLMSMQGGFTYNLGHPEILNAVKENNGKVTTRCIVNAIARTPILFEPGTDYNYSLCHDILGAVIEVASGKNFFDYLNNIIFTPLGMKDTLFWPDKAQLKRMQRQYHLDANGIAVEQPLSCIYSIAPGYESGGAGLASTVDDYIKFISCLSAGASPEGYSIIKPETLKVMRTSCLSEKSSNTFNKPGYTYALGVRVLVDPLKAQSLSPVGEFGWDGAAGSYVLGDPINGISAVYTQHVLNCGPAYVQVHPTIRDLIYEGLK